MRIKTSQKPQNNSKTPPKTPQNTPKTLSNSSGSLQTTKNLKKSQKPSKIVGRAVSQRPKRTLKILKYDKTTSQTSFRTPKPTLVAILPLTNTYFYHTSPKCEKNGKKKPKIPFWTRPELACQLPGLARPIYDRYGQTYSIVHCSIGRRWDMMGEKLSAFATVF